MKKHHIFGCQAVPPLYLDGRGEGSQLLQDFTYFKTSEAVEGRIERCGRIPTSSLTALFRDEALAELDQRVKEEHLASLTRSEHE